MIAAIITFFGFSSTMAIKPWDGKETLEEVAKRHGVTVTEVASAAASVAKFYKEKGVFKD